MILWKHHVSEHFQDGYGPNSGVGEGGHLHEDLAKLIAYCREDGREWSIARIVCDPSDVEPVPTMLPKGWYVARRDIISEEGFLPLNKAEEKYIENAS